MSFISLKFFLFLFLSLFVGYGIQKICKKRIRYIAFLLLVNYLFYSLWDWRFSCLLFFLTAVTFVCAILSQKKSVYTFVGVSVALGILCVFKYLNFFLKTLNLGTLNIIMPLGISFYTFEAISYLIDVKRKSIEPEKNFIVFATYLSFFPNISSGPIVKAERLLSQLKNNTVISYKNIEIGIQIMAIGYFKKMVIADRLSLFVNDVYKTPKMYNWQTICLAVVSYSIQIYMDFSGYSDIAIGCAKCFGFDFDRNFNLPYCSQSLTEFWRRWHISLSTWFRDYVYIPLGGNKKGITRQLLNLLIVMVLSGLWHGANWTFVIWGLINGILLCAEKFYIKKTESLNVLKMIAVFVIVSITWIFFRSETIEKALRIIGLALGLNKGVFHPYLWSFISIIVLGLLMLVCYKKTGYKMDAYYPVQDLSTIKGLTLFFIFIGLILCLAYTNTSPFVYLSF